MSINSSIGELRQMWEKAFDNPPPPRAGRELLELGVGWQQQSKTKGGLDRATREEIALLVRDIRAGREPVPSQRKAEVGSGSTLVREWNGKTYQVQVIDAGYLFEHKVWRSLSEIARAITGARWNGPKFFGLRQKEAA